MTGTKKLSIAVLFGLSTLLLLASLTSFCVALLAKLTAVSDSTLIVIVFVLALVSMLIAGFVSGMKAKMKGWFAGAATGFMFLFLVFLINYLGYSQTLSKESLMYHLGLIATSTIGGIFGVNAAKKE